MTYAACCCPFKDERKTQTGEKERHKKHRMSLCKPLTPSANPIKKRIVYLDREESPEIEALTPRGRPVEGPDDDDSAAEPAAVELVRGLGVDIKGRRFLGNSTQTRFFFTFSRHDSSQNQALSEEATSSEMGESPWHAWWKALGQPSHLSILLPGVDSCD